MQAEPCPQAILLLTRQLPSTTLFCSYPMGYGSRAVQIEQMSPFCELWRSVDAVTLVKQHCDSVILLYSHEKSFHAGLVSKFGFDKSKPVRARECC